MGYVGTAMATLVASSKNGKNFRYFVTGIEKNDKNGLRISKKINSGIIPIQTNDRNFKQKFLYATKKKKNFICLNNIDGIKGSKIVIVSINCDLKYNSNSDVNLNQFLRSIELVLKAIDKRSLLIIESTIPPGTCEKKIVPLIKKITKKRNMKYNDISLAYTYERVMPGKNYLDSIRNYWRVMSGIDTKSKNECKNFLKNIINTKKFPLTVLKNIRSCELGKILENSYRSINIALIEEWARFAESMNVDIYEIIEAIRLRPTHSNIRHPGFGVGGYCLTKDPLFGEYAAKKIWKIKNLDFKFSKNAMEINNRMPLESLKKLKKIFKNKMKNKKILILGMSYKENVGDLRSSPSLYFAQRCLKLNSQVYWHDPYIDTIKLKKATRINSLNNLSKFDLVLFAVKHDLYIKLKLDKKLTNTVIFDANYVLTKKQLNMIEKENINFHSIGR